MAVESKVIVTAEDRTAAAFAAISRNTGTTAMAMLKLQGQMLKLAGMGSLIAFFRTGAQSTEKWRDEMARLDVITEKFFKNSADAGRLNPFILAVKTAHVAALGLATGLEMAGLSLGAFAATAADVAKGNFREAYKTTGLLEADLIRLAQEFKKTKEEIYGEAPQGFAKHREEEAERVKAAQKGLKEAEEERLKMILEHASVAEDAIRAEMEISEGQSAPGLTAMGEGVFDEARAKEEEQAAEKEERERERLTRKVEQIRESFMTENEMAAMQYETRQMMIDDAFMQEIISAQEHSRLKEENELQHQARMGNVEAQGILARRKFEEMNAKQKTEFVLGQIIQLTQGVAANNKTMFQINKLATIANIALGIPLSVEKALESYPPPLSFVMAGLQLAASLAQMQQAKNAQFGASTSAPSVGGGGAAPVFNAADTSVPALAGPGVTGPTRIINVTLSGSQRYTAEEVRDLIEQINEEQADGVTVNMMPA